MRILEKLAAAQAEKPFLPESEQPGIKAMGLAVAAIESVGGCAHVLRIPAPGMKRDGWDVADAIDEGMSADDLRAFIGELPDMVAQDVEGSHTSERAGASAAASNADIASKAKRKPKSPAPPIDGKRPVTGFDATGRRFIRHDAGRLPEVLDAIGLALAEARQLNLFVHAGRIVRVYLVANAQRGIVCRPEGALILHAVEASHLAELATAAAGHTKFDSRSGEDKRIDCPRRAAESYLERGYWPELPVLDGFAEAPLVTPDARVIDQPGYHSGSQLFLAFGGIKGYSRPPSAPSKEDAERAMDVLLEAVGTFPFVDWSDRAAALAGIMTALLCRALPARPIFPVTAPTPGTGKSLLADTFAMIAAGRQASVLSLGHDDTEAEKRLGGVYLAGDLVVNIDNVERPLGGDLLCQATTQPLLRLRPLGSSGMLSVPTNALLIATGNNIQIKGDLKRRVCMIRLDAKQERPEQRSFSRNHMAYIAARRGELIRAALTIPLAYRAASEPAVKLHPMGGFELWDRMVRPSAGMARPPRSPRGKRGAARHRPRTRGHAAIHGRVRSDLQRLFLHCRRCCW